VFVFFVQAEDGIRDRNVTGVQTCALPISLPPVTGNDAEVAAIQRIVAGDQYNTISKPIKTVAEATAEVVVTFMKGDEPEADTTLFDTPSSLFTPEVVTQDNLKEVIVDGGIFDASEICTKEYKSDCKELGIE